MQKKLKRDKVNIKNYTSSVSVEDSVKNIEQLLSRVGATVIQKFYSDGVVAGVTFTIPINDELMTFRLPSNPAGAYNVMIDGVVKKRATTERRIREQSTRTAWKMLHEWVHIQLSMILMKQADVMQVFLPYLYIESRGGTLYEMIRGEGMKRLLTNGK